jgi:6-pyruvoyltetrahydropterin/6-carboxytetrahydropterin synthase
MTYQSTKTYGHNIGLACVFRQPNADHSHCHLLHGYSLAFKFTFGCKELDNKNWAVDFGGLKPLRAWLEDHFDHKLAYRYADNLITVKTDGRCFVESVECMEHGANSAIYKRP